MPLRLLACISLTIALALSGAAAQTRVRTETIKPAAADAKKVPEIVSDMTRLPAPVARMRERILSAARSGDPGKVAAVMRSNETMPIFSSSEARDPSAYWKENYPESAGLEALSILIGVLESPFVHVEQGTPQEMYLWPYFARVPLRALTPEQKVELFRIVTGADYREMLEAGTYSFYRVGIGPDGTWHFFVTGD
jgi:hypothetical protein